MSDPPVKIIDHTLTGTASGSFNGTLKRGQVFTTPASPKYTPYSFMFRARRGSTTPVGIMYVKLHPVYAETNLPIEGTVLAQMEYDATKITYSSLTWITCLFDTPVTPMEVTTRYAVVLHAPSCASNQAVFYSAETGGGYADGGMVFYNGSTWSYSTSSDMAFRVYGEPFIVSPGGGHRGRTLGMNRGMNRGM